jgi:hypothetical protein
MGHTIHDADGTDAGPTVRKSYDLTFVTLGRRLAGAPWLRGGALYLGAPAVAAGGVGVARGLWLPLVALVVSPQP